MLLAFGIVLRRSLEARASGQGQVVDAAMVDGAALLMTMMHGMQAMGAWSDERGVNLLDTGAPLLRRLRDAPTASSSRSGAIEPQFYAELLAQHRPRAGDRRAPGSTTAPVAGH